MLVRAFLAEALDPVAHEAARARAGSARSTRLVGAGRPHERRSPPSPLPRTLDVARIRADFPILSQTVRGKPLVFLDSAASAQKPRAVIDAMRDAMETQYANVHRGLHWMSERTTDAYEARARCGRRRCSTRRTGTRSSSRATAPRRSTCCRTATAAAS